MLTHPAVNRGIGGSSPSGS
ncbi:unnamed protein product, partial [Rotaria sp. Silwood2]